MHADPLIAIGGENLIDSVQTIADDGTVTWAHNLGGSPYNVAVALARQGVQSHYLTPLSTDDLGTQLADALTREGVVIAAQRRDEPTTQAIVTLKDGVPTYLFHRDGTAERCVTAARIAAALPQQAAHFHAGSLAFIGGADADAWEEAFGAATRDGLTTSLDPNVRASLVEDDQAYRARLMRLFSQASIVKLSDEDLEWIYPNQSMHDAISALREVTSARLIVLTKGPDGAEGWTPTAHVAVANPPLETLVDTIGAGDTLMATILASLASQGQLTRAALDTLTRDDLHRVLSRGVQAACLNCAQEGCDPPSLSTLDAALAGRT